MNKNELKRKAQIAGCASMVVGGAVLFIYASKKQKAIIEAAKQTGVNEWLREMHDDKLTILVVTQDLAERMFEAAQDIAINERFTTPVK